MTNIELFTIRTRQFVRYFNLIDYNVCIQPASDDDVDYYACCMVNEVEEEEDGRVATIEFSEEQMETLEPWQVEQVAFHEVLELLLLTLRQHASNDSASLTLREADREAHAIINTLTNTLFMQALHDAKKIEVWQC